MLKQREMILFLYTWDDSFEVANVMSQKRLTNIEKHHTYDDDLALAYWLKFVEKWAISKDAPWYQDAFSPFLVNRKINFFFYIVQNHTG